MLIFLGVIVFVIFIHEMGHLLAARAVGVKADAFSIGFGKVLLKKTMFGTEWRLSLLPLGGYVKLRGDTDFDNTANDPHSFWAASPWRRALIAVAGPVTNLLLAWPLYFMMLVGQPYPDVVTPQGATPARIGVIEAADYAHRISVKVYKDIWKAVTNRPKTANVGLKDLGGPAAVYQITEQAAELSEKTGDWGFLIDWIVFLSINLGVINLLPIPILDGGHVTMNLYEGITRHSISAKTRNILNIVGALLVFALMTLAIASDVIRIGGL